ncbi:MAG TPA: hypothetical protein VIO62_11080 [Candidatus Dormibacteraeota bacterium]|jgi:hypothetical protein
MNPKSDDVEALARAIDRVVFADTRASAAPEAQTAALALVSYLNDSFPQVAIATARRDRLQRRIARALAIPRAPSTASLVRLEAEMNRRLGSLDPRWGPVVGGTALVILGVLGFAVWRRGTVRPAVATPR